MPYTGRKESSDLFVGINLQLCQKSRVDVMSIHFSNETHPCTNVTVD